MATSKKYLIIGGSGSLGQHLVRHLIDTRDVKPRHITIMSRDEGKQHVMQQSKIFKHCQYEIHDIRDSDGLSRIVENNDVVINCAAIKHVSKAQNYVMEAVKTNMLGTYNLLCAVHNSDKLITFVTLSTDKAVEATNYYGATKFLTEGLVKNFARNDPLHRYYSVRYGNVYSSSNSIGVIFERLAKESKTIYITDDRMTRFLMFLEDAVDVVMFACDDMPTQNGCVLVPLNLPSYYVRDFAEIVVESVPESKSQIKVSKIGSGEKLEETLLNQEEGFVDNIDVFGTTSSGIQVAQILEKDVNRKSVPIVYSSANENLVLTKNQLKEILLHNGIINICQNNTISLKNK